MEPVATPPPAPLVVVSSDTHAGPLLTEQLRPYCPARYLDDFDAFVARRDSDRAALATLMSNVRIPDDEAVRHYRNLQTSGHHNMRDRLRDLTISEREFESELRAIFTKT